MVQKLVARFFNERAGVFFDPKRDLNRAEKLLSRAAAIAPGWAVPWYNLGLVAKWQRRWRDALDWNQKAVALDPSNQPAWWNLGIAATALGDWAEARLAWTAYGIQLPPGEGAIEMELGPTPIRLNPSSSCGTSAVMIAQINDTFQYHTCLTRSRLTH
jgi:tetratricopeptide (TPR) repeat protein